MKTVAEYTTELDRLEHDQPLDDKEQKRRRLWVALLIRQNHERYPDLDEDADPDENDIVAVIQQAVLDGSAVCKGVQCDHCRTELVVVRRDLDPSYTRDFPEYLACPGCGFWTLWDSSRERSLRLKELVQKLDAKLSVLTHLAGLLASSPAPTVVHSGNGRIELELPENYQPLNTFAVTPESLDLRMHREGRRVTFELRGDPVQADDSPTFWEAVQEDEVDPEAPLCECGQPIAFGRDKCTKCQNDNIFRQWVR